MSSGDGEQGAIPPTQEKMAEMMEALMRRQEQRFQDMMVARMTRAGAREEGDYSGQGVNIGRSSPTPGDLEVASREEFVESASTDVGAREFSSLRQAVTYFSGLPDEFPAWSKRFEAFMSMNGSLNSLPTEIEVAVGDTAEDTQRFLSQGLNVVHTKKSCIAWVCLTESMSDTDLLDRVFAKQSPSGAWKIFRDWFLPRSMATQVKWLDAFGAVQMGKGEEPMKFFSRVDKIVGILTSLGVQKSVGDVHRKLVRVLTSDYEMEQRALLYRDEISRVEIENIVRQRHLRLPVSTGGNVDQALWTSGQDNGGSGRNRNKRKPRNSNNSTRRDSSNSSNSSDSSRSFNNSNNSNNSSNSSNSSNIPQSAYDLVRGKCIRCSEPGHRWRECTAPPPPS